MAKQGTEAGVWAAKDPAVKDRYLLTKVWWLEEHHLETRPQSLKTNDLGSWDSDDSLTQIHPLDEPTWASREKAASRKENGIAPCVHVGPWAAL